MVVKAHSSVYSRWITRKILHSHLSSSMILSKSSIIIKLSLLSLLFTQALCNILFGLKYFLQEFPGYVPS